MGKHSGRKFGRHSTAIPAAEPVVKAASRDPRVTKVSLGRMRAVGNGQRWIKFTPINGGWKVTVRGNRSIQDIMVYTHATKVVKRVLRRAFELGK